jgi:hypothetical protein
MVGSCKTLVSTKLHGGIYQNTVVSEPIDFHFKLLLFFSLHGFRIKSRRMRWAGHVARMGEGRGAYRIMVGRPEGRRPLGRPRCRWEDNIKMDLQEVRWGGMDWIDMAQDRTC